MLTSLYFITKSIFMRSLTNLKKISLLILCLLVFTSLHAQKLDKVYADLIKKYTTDARFLPKTLQTFPASSTLPSPLKHFGKIIGAPGVMHHTKDIFNYYSVLAAKSDRMKMITLRNSEEGRPIHLLIISSPENLKNLEKYKKNLNKLADPRTLKNTDIAALVSNTKPMYYLNGGLHSTEMGSPEMLMELVFRMLVEESRQMKNIRENVITLINPV